MASGTGKGSLAAAREAEAQPAPELRGASSVADELTEAIAQVSPSQVGRERANNASRLSGSNVGGGVEANGIEDSDINTSDLASFINNTLLQESPDIVRGASFSTDTVTESATAFLPPDPNAAAPDLDQNNFHINSITARFPPYSTNPAAVPGSRHGSVDSDMTEDLPPEGPIDSNPHIASHYHMGRTTAFSASRPRLTLGPHKPPVTPQQQRRQSKIAATQESQKPSLRPRVSSSFYFRILHGHLLPRDFIATLLRVGKS